MSQSHHVAKRSGDPADLVRLYLEQLGRFPLLREDEQSALAARIESTRRLLYREIVESGLTLRRVAEALTQASAGQFALARKLGLSRIGPRRRPPFALARAARTLARHVDFMEREVARSREPSHDRLTAQRHAAVRILARLRLNSQAIVRLGRELTRRAACMEAIHEKAAVGSGGSTTSPVDSRRLGIELLEKPDAFLRRAARVRSEIDNFCRDREQLACANLRLVVHLARHYRATSLPFLDLIQEGNAGLLRAVDGFDHRRGVRFSSYAARCVRRAMALYVAEHSGAVRLPLRAAQQAVELRRSLLNILQRQGVPAHCEEAARTAGVAPRQAQRVLLAAAPPLRLDDPLRREGNLTLADVLPTPSPDQVPEAGRLGRALGRVLLTLSFREREVIRLRYGLGGIRPHTLQEVGHRFRCTREYIRQIEAAAVRKLQHPARVQWLESCLDDDPSIPDRSNSARSHQSAAVRNA